MKFGMVFFGTVHAKFAQIGVVHGDNVVKFCKITLTILTRAKSANVDAPACGRMLCAGIRSFVGMKVERTAGVDVKLVHKASLGDQGAKHAFGGRTPADVAHAHEQYAGHAFFSPRLVDSSIVFGCIHGLQDRP